MRHCLLKRSTLPFAAAAVLTASSCSTVPVESPTSSDGRGVAGSGSGVRLENLLSADLEGVENTEVVVSQVTIPPNTSLPKHWHPGEEFAYVLDGSVTLWQKGKPNTAAKVGDALKVPLKQIHTAITGDEKVTLLVFRVHEKGQPERIMAERPS